MRAQGSLPPPGTATRVLCGLLLGVSVVGAMTQRKLGIGVDELVLDMAAVQAGEIWRLFSYVLVKRSPFSLLLSTVVLYLFGRFYEGKWGSGAYLRFFAVSSIGAAVLALPLHALINLAMPFTDLGIAEGPDAVVDAMLVALALDAPRARVMFGFILPMTAQHMVLVVLGIELLGGLMTGVATTSITLGGMFMGYLMATGNWRPQVLWARLRARRRRRRAREGLYVVPPRDRSVN